jgi:probable biosynthetic protein (TIGR04098 family)
VQTHAINRIVDYNTADFIYFKKYVRLARAAEWRLLRDGLTAGALRLNAQRACFFYGNADDGEVLASRVAIDGAALQTNHHAADDRRLFLSLADLAPAIIAPR